MRFKPDRGSQRYFLNTEVVKFQFLTFEDLKESYYAKFQDQTFEARLECLIRILEIHIVPPMCWVSQIPE